MNLRKAAKGRDCQIRIPGHCNFDPETSVLCHKGGAGIALKSDDRIAAIGCSECHAIVDGARKTGLDPDYIKLCFYEGIFRTQELWIKEGFM